MTPDQLSRATGASLKLSTIWFEAIDAAMKEFGITTPKRQAMFLAQIGHESGALRYSVEIWGPTPAQSRYEGRKDLGNVQTGDGSRFRGRGFIQITGRANYKAAGIALGVDALAQPELLAQPTLVARSAAWWWREHGLNEIADAGDVVRATKRINGGDTGLAERQALYTTARQVFA